MTTARNSGILWTIPLLIMICLFSLTAQAQYGGGTGEPNDPYLIYTAEQMNEIGINRDDWEKHFKLMADIDLSGYTETSFNIIGESSYPAFKGVFDGCGHVISNFTYDTNDAIHVGLFGFVRGRNAQIKDLGLVDPNIDAKNGHGAAPLVCWTKDGATISNCYVEGGSVIGKSIVGGLVAGHETSYIVNCHFDGTVFDSGPGDLNWSGVGGLVGVNKGTISDCSSAGSVTGIFNVGGLVGINESFGTIINSFSDSIVTGEMYTGGLVGHNLKVVKHSYATGSVTGERFTGGLIGRSQGHITSCYSTASTTGTENVGGLMGKNSGGKITNCYSAGSVTGTTNVGGLVGPDDWGKGEVVFSFWDIQASSRSISGGGIGKTTAEMLDPNTFMTSGWDFVDKTDGPGDIWAEPAGGGYPILWWQLSPLPELPAFSGGTGEPNDPYLISTATDLNTIGHNSRLMKAYFRLTDDIDLAGITYYIIGNETYPYQGVFDGNGHTISNLSHTSKFYRTEGIGLFGYVNSFNAEIIDLGLIGPKINGRDDTGALVGQLGRGTVSVCYAEGGFISGRDNVGGLVGFNYIGTVINCYSKNSIIGTGSGAGSLVGNNNKTIIESYAMGSVIGNTDVGGIAGHNSRVITNCYSGGSVLGDNNTGGLVGTNSNSGTIVDCYSISSVVGIEHTGGLIGSGSSAHNSFWDVQASGQNASAGGKGRTTAQMLTASTFLGWNGCGNEEIWTIEEGNDYPRLWWENKPGEVLETQELSALLTGAGTEEDPYLIYTAEELNVIGLFPCELDKYFKLMADIDLSNYKGTEFNVIGLRGFYYLDDVITNTSSFTGVFDGNGKKIANLTHSRGLFVYAGGEIKDLGVIDVNINGEYSAGSLVSENFGGTMSNCYAEGGSVSGGEGNIGGLVGESYGIITNCHTKVSVFGTGRVGGLVGNNDEIISNCYSNGDTSGNNKVGGLVGENSSHTTISKCYSSGSITGTGSYVGGLVGFNRQGTIDNCYSNADVSGQGFVGGLVGENSWGTILKCFSAGSVVASPSNEWLSVYVGGFAGENKGQLEFMDSFWDIQTSGQSTSATGTGKTTVEMQMLSTFTDAGWDFVYETDNGTEDIWWIDEGQDYPRLWWEPVK